MLLNFNADRDIAGKNGTARDVALLCNQQEILELLDGVAASTYLLT